MRKNELPVALLSNLKRPVPFCLVDTSTGKLRDLKCEDLKFSYNECVAVLTCMTHPASINTVRAWSQRFGMLGHDLSMAICLPKRRIDMPGAVCVGHGKRHIIFHILTRHLDQSFS